MPERHEKARTNSLGEETPDLGSSTGSTHCLIRKSVSENLSLDESQLTLSGVELELPT